MHVNGIGDGKERGLLAKTETPPGPFVPLLFPGREGGDQDWEVADAECNAVLDGT